MSRENFEKILNGDVAEIDNIEEQNARFSDLEIPVLPIHVKNVLLLYLNKKISDDELVKWASFVNIRSEYVCKDSDIHGNGEFYEDMFNVIECISVPEINYKITPENIKIYLKELDKYFNGNDEQY